MLNGGRCMSGEESDPANRTPSADVDAVSTPGTGATELAEGGDDNRNTEAGSDESSASGGEGPGTGANGGPRASQPDEPGTAADPGAGERDADTEAKPASSEKRDIDDATATTPPGSDEGAAPPKNKLARWLQRLASPDSAAKPIDSEAALAVAAENPWGIAARSVVLGLLLGISLMAWARFSFDAFWLVEFLTKNRLGLEQRMGLIGSMLGGALVGVLSVGGVLVWSLKKQRPLAVVEQWMWFLAPLTLAPTLPLMLRYRAWEDAHDDLLPAILFVGLVLELFVYRALVNVPPAAKRMWEGAKTEVPALLRRHGPVLVVVGAAVAYAIFMSFYTIRWHHKLGTGNYDLGINNNMMYGGLFGDFNQSRIVFPDHPQQYIANHVKIGAYVFLPIYALAPRPETLQIIQSTLLGMGAVPLFLFARRWVTQWMAAIIALCWLAYYPIHGANFYEVKWVPVASFFVLTAVWAADAKRWVTFGVAAVIGMLMREDMPVGFAIIGGFLVLSGHRPRAGLILTVVAGAWFVLLRFYIMEEAGEWWFPKMYKDLWAEGETGFRSVIKTLVSNPFFTLKHVLVEKKVIYLMHLLVPLLFLPARRWYLWASFLPGAILTLLVTDYKPVTMFSFQYVMHWAPYMFLALPLALVAYEREAPTGRARSRAALGAVAFTIAVLSYNYGAFPARDGALKSGYHSISFSFPDEERQRYAELMEIIKSIPPGASVAATEKIGPHVSSRRVFYSLRRDSYHADYLIARQKGLRLDRTKRVITDALTSGEYGVFRKVGQFVLIKRGHSTQGNQAVIDDWRLKPMGRVERRDRTGGPMRPMGTQRDDEHHEMGEPGDEEHNPDME